MHFHSAVIRVYHSEAMHQNCVHRQVKSVAKALHSCYALRTLAGIDTAKNEITWMKSRAFFDAFYYGYFRVPCIVPKSLYIKVCLSLYRSNWSTASYERQRQVDPLEVPDTARSGGHVLSPNKLGAFDMSVPTGTFDVSLPTNPWKFPASPTTRQSWILVQDLTFCSHFTKVNGTWSIIQSSSLPPCVSVWL